MNSRYDVPPEVVTRTLFGSASRTSRPMRCSALSAMSVSSARVLVSTAWRTGYAKKIVAARMMPTTTIATTISISVMPCWRALGSIGGIAQSIAIERYRGSRGHMSRRDGYSQPVGQGDARDRVRAGDLSDRDVQPVVG